jgi:hypothetical protein
MLFQLQEIQKPRGWGETPKNHANLLTTVVPTIPFSFTRITNRKAGTWGDSLGNYLLQEGCNLRLPSFHRTTSSSFSTSLMPVRRWMLVMWADPLSASSTNHLASKSLIKGGSARRRQEEACKKKKKNEARGEKRNFEQFSRRLKSEPRVQFSRASNLRVLSKVSSEEPQRTTSSEYWDKFTFAFLFMLANLCHEESSNF